MSQHILSLDEGTTSTRAVLYDNRSQVVFSTALPLDITTHPDGRVEQDATQLWERTVQVLRDCVTRAVDHDLPIAALAIAAQRTTTVLWNATTGEPVAPVISWQDTRVELEQVRQRWGEQAAQVTGMILAPCNCGLHVAWLLDHDPELRAAADRGELMAGTPDAYLIWKLTGGPDGGTFATSSSCAGSTGIMDLRDRSWWKEFLDAHAVPDSIWPPILDEDANYGTTRTELIGAALPIIGVFGDQQSALFGQGGFATGSVKCTHGTGSFIDFNIGPDAVVPGLGLDCRVAWTTAPTSAYLIEGGSFVTGSGVDWMVNQLGVLDDSSQIDARYADGDPDSGLISVPALAGFAAPYWDASVRGLMVGFHRGTTKNEVVRATVDGIAHTVTDILQAMAQAAGVSPTVIQVDGGLGRSDALLQAQADLMQVPVVRAAQAEFITSRGAAWCAGVTAGVWPIARGGGRHRGGGDDLRAEDGCGRAAGPACGLAGRGAANLGVASRGAAIERHDRAGVSGGVYPTRITVDPGDLPGFYCKLSKASGSDRTLSMRRIRLGVDALDSLDAELDELAGTGRVVLVSDDTPMLRADVDLKALVRSRLSRRTVCDLVLSQPGGLHADQRQVELLKDQLRPGDTVVSLGSGTVTDLSKHAVHLREQQGDRLTHLAIATANSVGAYTSQMAVITTHGVKRTVPSRLPDVLLLDTSILASTPSDIALGGIGDAAVGWSSMADYWLAHRCGLGDFEPLCAPVIRPGLEPFLARDLSLDVDAPPVLRADAMARSLVSCGFAMTLAGESAPASGLEHVTSHMLDLLAEHRDRPIGNHGEQCGLATALVLFAYRQMLEEFDPAVHRPQLVDLEALHTLVLATFEPLDPSGAIGQECWSDVRVKATSWNEHLAQIADLDAHWPQLRSELAAVLADPDEYLAALHATGHPLWFEQVPPGIPDDQVRWAFGNARLMRKRLSVADFLAFHGLWTAERVSRIFAEFDQARQRLLSRGAGTTRRSPG